VYVFSFSHSLEEFWRRELRLNDCCRIVKRGTVSIASCINQFKITRLSVYARSTHLVKYSPKLF